MKLLLTTFALGVFFVIVTGNLLPPVVATHFVAGGAANGFMPRNAYLAFIIALLLGLPMLIAMLSNITNALPVRFINLPHRDYWLAPERQADTLAYLRSHGRFLAVLFALFVCFVHWLVIEANAHVPPVFPEYGFFVGAATFLVGLAVWLAGLIVRFRRRP